MNQCSRHKCVRNCKDCELFWKNNAEADRFKCLGLKNAVLLQIKILKIKKRVLETDVWYKI